MLYNFGAKCMKTMKTVLTVVLLSALSLILTQNHFVHHVDTIAHHVGYFVSIALFPLVWVLIPPIVVMGLFYKEWSTAIKAAVALTPLVLNLIFIGGVMLVLQYAPH